MLDDVHLYRAIRYIENNPCRAKIVKNAWDYKWSSAADRTGEREKPLIKLKHIDIEEDWKEYLKESDVEMNNEIRVKTSRGLIVGTDEFINKIERTLNRSLRCLSQGRPKRNS